MIEFPGARDELGKKEIQRLCCFRIDDDDDVREMLNINFVFKLSNFDRDVSLTMSMRRGNEAPDWTMTGVTQCFMFKG